MRRSGHDLRVDVDAPYFGDPAPTSAIGPTDKLWEYEVSELFIADAAEHYLEIELSPHGHHLVLELNGTRRIARSGLPIKYSVRIQPSRDAAHPEVLGRYRGSALIPLAYLPSQPTRVNAYLIHGVAANRCYHAHHPPFGETPDFHRLASFVPFTLA